MADKILSQMAMFDFSAPIQTVTMFDDDSDEEKYSSSSKKQRTEKSLIAQSLHHEVDIISSSGEEIHIKEDIAVENDCVIEKEEKKDNVTTNKVEKNISNNSKPFDLTISQPNDFPLHKVENEENVNGNNVEDNRNEPQTSDDKNPTPNVHYEDTSEKCIPEQVNTVTSLNNSDSTNDNEIMSAYLKKLINAVSEHLLMILTAYRYYVNAQKTGNQILIEKGRKNYIQIKYHHFNLSFLVVETLFVPQVHTQANYTFARNFIECTMRIAKAKSIECSFEHIEPLYLEMLEWTKEKSKYFKKISSFYLTPKAHSMMHSNNKNLEITKEHTQNIHAQNLILPPQRVGSVSTQNHPQYPTVRPSLIHPSIPRYYDKRTNLEYNTIKFKNACSNSKLQNNQEIIHHPNSFGGSYVCNNNLSNSASENSAIGATTCLANGQRAFQYCGYCQQNMQCNIAIEHAATTPGVSYATSMDPIHYNVG